MSGAKPPIPMLIPAMPSTEDLLPYLQRIDQSKIYSNFGPLVNELELRLADYFSVDQANIATASNGTLALAAAIATAPAPADAEWYAPSWTFTATAAAALQVNKTIRFCDVDTGWRASPAGGARFLIDVLAFGDEADSSRFEDPPECLIIDAAASFDALQAVALPEAVCCGAIVSLHATKLVSTGEGGVFISNDPDWVQRFRRWTNFGMWGSRNSIDAGSNAKLSEYAAAVGLASLDKWPAVRFGWEISKHRSLERCRTYGFKTAPAMQRNHVTPYWQVDFESAELADAVSVHFSEMNIETRKWWSRGCHEMPAYACVPQDDLAHTALIAATTLGLPCFPSMTDDQWSRIDAALTAVMHGR